MDFNEVFICVIHVALVLFTGVTQMNRNNPPPLMNVIFFSRVCCR